jgi:hypothetical protein
LKWKREITSSLLDVEADRSLLAFAPETEEIVFLREAEGIASHTCWMSGMRMVVFFF